MKAVIKQNYFGDGKRTRHVRARLWNSNNRIKRSNLGSKAITLAKRVNRRIHYEPITGR